MGLVLRRKMYKYNNFDTKLVNERVKQFTKQIKRRISGELSEDEFKPHTMWDPKTGKAYMAKTHDDHIRMGKMGYTHKDPKEEELSAKQKKIARLGGNKKRIDAADFRKLRRRKKRR